VPTSIPRKLMLVLSLDKSLFSAQRAYHPAPLQQQANPQAGASTGHVEQSADEPL